MTRATTQSFVRALVADLPELNLRLKEHLDDNFGELLPHVFFGDVAHWAEQQAASRPASLSQLLDHLDLDYATGTDSIREVIALPSWRTCPTDHGFVRHWARICRLHLIRLKTFERSATPLLELLTTAPPDIIANRLSSGASCTIDSDSIAARIAQGSGFAGTLLLGGAGEGIAAAREAEEAAALDRAVLFKGDPADLTLGPGERTLNLPSLGSPKANWIQNSGKLREEIGQVFPFVIHRSTGDLNADRRHRFSARRAAAAARPRLDI